MSIRLARKLRGAAPGVMAGSGTWSLTSLARFIVPSVPVSCWWLWRSTTSTTGWTLTLNLNGGAGDADTVVTESLPPTTIADASGLGAVWVAGPITAPVASVGAKPDEIGASATDAAGVRSDSLYRRIRPGRLVSLPSTPVGSPKNSGTSRSSSLSLASPLLVTASALG